MMESFDAFSIFPSIENYWSYSLFNKQLTKNVNFKQTKNVTTISKYKLL